LIHANRAEIVLANERGEQRIENIAMEEKVKNFRKTKQTFPWYTGEHMK